MTDTIPAFPGPLSPPVNGFRPITPQEECEVEIRKLVLTLPSYKWYRWLKKARYKIAFGGRGGAKSWTIAELLVVLASKHTLRILCAREIQKSITESVHQLLSDTITRLGLESIFTIQNNSIVCKNGSEFIFAGLRTNVTEIKSMEGIDICWVEEAQAVSKQSWKLLIPTIRKAGSEIWISFNPDKKSDPTSQFILNPPASSVVTRVGLDDNPYASAELHAERARDYANDPETAANVWGGEFSVISDAQIMRGKYVIQDFVPTQFWEGPYFGGDFGFAKDPAIFVKCYVHENKLYIEWESDGVGVDIDELFNLFDKIPDAVVRVKDHETKSLVLAPQQWEIHCDCSRPETISFLRKSGLNALPAKKWSGSVEDGIAFLRGYDQIVIHSRCKRGEQEARDYSYKVDRLTNQVLPIIIDANNHFWDAVRYALQPLISQDEEPALLVLDANEFRDIHPLDAYDMQLEVNNW